MVESQDEVIGFLSSPSSYAASPPVERHDTHGAIVFLAGAEAYKIKRAVAYPYMDFSSPAKRRAILQRENEINRDNAPMIYRGVVPITRSIAGQLAFGGEGEPVEWALHMRRFPTADVLANRFAKEPPPDAFVHQLAHAVFTSHCRSPALRERAASHRLAIVLDQLGKFFSDHPGSLPPELADHFLDATRRALAKSRDCLDLRGRCGAIRRCHGDLHLGNIVAIDGEPVLFDAIEFSEEIATIDTLYDLAFLVMDLEARGLRSAANLLLNRYLFETGSILDIHGLAALPLCMALRAGVRAMATLERGCFLAGGGRTCASAQARVYLEWAVGELAPRPPRLVAIGGRSGTGKSTLARALAPSIGQGPGALHLRSDLERKRLLGVTETGRLGPEGYAPAVTREVYRRLGRKARVALLAGATVVVDATHLDAGARHLIEGVARAASTPFTGLWLVAPVNVALARVLRREGDASDASPAVVRTQYGQPVNPVGWTSIAAEHGLDDVLAMARQVLGL